MNILLIGPQGCGKGTQADYIIKHYHFHHIESGTLIRKQASEPTKKGELINNLANYKGMLIPDGIIINLIQTHLTTIGYDDLLFDGFPRTLNQYLALKELLKQNHHFIDLAIYLDLADSEAVKRLSSRRFCSVCHKTFSTLLEPQRTNCECGESLSHRSDDEPEAIENRLKLFREQSQPVLTQLQADKILRTIDAHQSVEQISKEISQLLG